MHMVKPQRFDRRPFLSQIGRTIVIVTPATIVRKGDRMFFIGKL